MSSIEWYVRGKSQGKNNQCSETQNYFLAGCVCLGLMKLSLSDIFQQDFEHFSLTKSK